MLLKPFKPPTVLKKLPASSDEPPPAKRRRTSGDGDGDSDHGEKKAVFVYPATAARSAAKEMTIPPRAQFRKPLNIVRNLGHAPAPKEKNADATYYNVLWRKPTAKKHKTWDGDGVLKVAEGVAYLRDNETGREMGKVACPGPLLPESSLSIAGKTVEVESLVSREDSISAKSFLKPRTSNAAAAAATSTPKLPQSAPAARLSSKAAALEASESSKKTLNVAATVSQATHSRFKNPVPEGSAIQKGKGAEITPRHDVNAAGALVMKRPRHVPMGKNIVDVVVDPILSKHLREHQREGTKFLYECVMGMRAYDGQGAILADEMGLGKTLQTIALIWTLLKQNPIHGDAPVIKKAVIVCPVTLINNWRKEFRKWLGSERIGIFIADATKNRITDFTKGKSYSVMIIGYEKVRKLAEDLQKGHGVDLIVADEGHRLKTAQNKSAVAMKSLATPRRIILSGTPIQNDLSEFFSMVDFVNPGILGSLKKFTKDFEEAIIRSRQPEAISSVIEKGQARSEELAETTAPFILRRTADILSEYLPTKVEYVLLCRPTSAQAAVYRQVLALPLFQSALGSSESTLQLITVLKKVCNSPKLLQVDPNVDSEKSSLSTELASGIAPRLLSSNSASTKLRVLDQLLHTIRTQTSEKVVLVSNFTSTLDLIATLLTSLSLPFLRLDGSTPVAKRQELVDTFNRTPAASVFAFLLSAKAGGMGLNLVGASRLVLFDIDWNPATDAQAMARIHRDGQARPCFIYRLLMAGGLDEKIWQRQVTKIGLADSVMQQRSGGVAAFTRDELRDLFRLDENFDAGCQTHELIGCACGGRGGMLDAGSASGSSSTAVDTVDEEAGAAASGERTEVVAVEKAAESGTTPTTPADTDDDDDDDYEEDPDLHQDRTSYPSFTRCSQLDAEAMLDDDDDDDEDDAQKHNTAILKRRKQKAHATATPTTGTSNKLQSLMAYSHINTSAACFGVKPKGGGEGAGEEGGEERDVVEMEALVRDSVLLSVLRDEENKVGFVFAKASGVGV